MVSWHVEASGPPQRPTYTCVAYLAGVEIGRGSGPNQEAAKESTAARALANLPYPPREWPPKVPEKMAKLAGKGRKLKLAQPILPANAPSRVSGNSRFDDPRTSGDQAPSSSSTRQGLGGDSLNDEGGRFKRLVSWRCREESLARIANSHRASNSFNSLQLIRTPTSTIFANWDGLEPRPRHLIHGVKG
ncbi:hypothetical protein BDN67DRAFT_971015 [Paxillus ammoniavirescens]|nr:hypothetical protein BDN67DRAFT_971015 [Paxillus ammoniavirescens]